MKPRFIAIMQKEFIHIWRDPRSLTIIILLPLVMIFLYGYAITFDIKEIKIGILDQDRSPTSREMVRQLTKSGYFVVTADLHDRSEIEPAFLGRKIVAAVIIPDNFSRDLNTSFRIPVQLLVDGSNSNLATVTINYIKTFFLTYSLQINARLLNAPIDMQPRVWYNPDLKSANFIAPGLVAVIMMLICALLTSATIARERETGTMEQILVSPIRSAEIIVGKTFPYIFLAIIDAIAIVVFAWVVFKVPFRGHPLLFLFFAVVYVYTCLSLGIFISARVKTQQVALMAAQLVTTLPSLLLSGFIFPIVSMPKVLQLISYIVPAKYFLVIIRSVMLKGVGMAALWQPTLFLLVFGTLLLFISVKRFKTNLEG
ncbi:ABC transporter permease [candidate division KSB1 bacterium]|nr:ABC transporter permease [candidate division KSB1 bacterium]